MSRPRRGDIVEVLWRDSEHIALGWSATGRYLDAAGSPQSYRTAGYWLGKRGGSVVLALSCDPANRTVTHCMAIPATSVERTTVLGRARRRVRKALKP
jgi:hypothetical protein